MHKSDSIVGIPRREVMCSSRSLCTATAKHPWIYILLVALKKMSSSLGIMKFPTVSGKIRKKCHTITNQIIIHVSWFIIIFPPILAKSLVSAGMVLLLPAEENHDMPSCLPSNLQSIFLIYTRKALLVGG